MSDNKQGDANDDSATIPNSQPPEKTIDPQNPPSSPGSTGRISHEQPQSPYPTAPPLQPFSPEISDPQYSDTSSPVSPSSQPATNAAQGQIPETTYQQTIGAQPLAADPYTPNDIQPAGPANHPVQLSEAYLKAIDEAIPLHKLPSSAEQPKIVAPEKEVTVTENHRTLPKLGIISIILGVIVLLALVGVLAKSLISGGNYRTYDITNDKTTYSLSFFKGASSITHNGIHELRFNSPNSKTSITATVYKINKVESCAKEFNFLATDYSVTIENRLYVVCSGYKDTVKDTILVTNFEVNGSENQMTVFTNNDTTTLTTSSMKTIFDSVFVK